MRFEISGTWRLNHHLVVADWCTYTLNALTLKSAEYLQENISYILLGTELQLYFKFPKTKWYNCAIFLRQYVKYPLSLMCFKVPCNLMLSFSSRLWIRVYVWACAVDSGGTHTRLGCPVHPFHPESCQIYKVHPIPQTRPCSCRRLSKRYLVVLWCPKKGKIISDFTKYFCVPVYTHLPKFPTNLPPLPKASLSLFVQRNIHIWVPFFPPKSNSLNHAGLSTLSLYWTSKVTDAWACYKSAGVRTPLIMSISKSSSKFKRISVILVCLLNRVSVALCMIMQPKTTMRSPFRMVMSSSTRSQSMTAGCTALSKEQESPACSLLIMWSVSTETDSQMSFIWQATSSISAYNCNVKTLC